MLPSTRASATKRCQPIRTKILGARTAYSSEWRLLQRAVFVVDRAGRLAHVEYVADQMAEPDYGAALQAAQLAANQSAPIA